MSFNGMSVIWIKGRQGQYFFRQSFDQKKKIAIECAKKFVSKTLDDLVGQVNLLSQFQRRFFVQALLASCTASGRKCWTTSLTDMEPDSRTSPISTCFDFFFGCVCFFVSNSGKKSLYTLQVPPLNRAKADLYLMFLWKMVIFLTKSRFSQFDQKTKMTDVMLTATHMNF